MAPRKKKETMTNVLKRELLASDASQYRLAKDSGVDPMAISRFLSDERDIRLGTADKLADVLDLELVKRTKQ